MSVKRAAVILVNYKDYAEKFLPDCIESLRGQSLSQNMFKIFIVDNESTPKTANYLREIAPEAELILNERNNGFAKANNQALCRAMQQGFEYLVCLNMDTIVAREWLEELMKAASLYPEAGAIQSLIMLYPETDRINSIGNELHYLGIGFCKGCGQKYSAYSQAPGEITCFSGAAVLFPAQALKSVGMYDERFFIYYEDTDLSWRMRMAGYKIFIAPKSVVYHRYQFSSSIKQFYFLERNRIIMLLENYKFPTIFLLFPAFFFVEICMFFYSMVNHAFLQKLKAYLFFLKSSNIKCIMASRKEKKRKRKLKDKEIIIKYFTSRIEPHYFDWKILKICVRYLANPISTIYWYIVKIIMWW